MTETAVSGQPSVVSYTWDNNGNLLNDGSRTFTYDSANRLTSVVSGSVTSQFTYNGDGDRMAQIVAGVTTNYALDPAGLAQVLIETTSGQNIHYLPGLAQYGGNAWSYYLPDRLGSVRQVVDPSAAVALAQSFDPFGQVLEQTSAGQSAFGYTGEQMDPTGLVFLRARYYNPAVGRFLTADSVVPDPLRSVGWNRYGYVGNNPISYVDPSGHCRGLSGTAFDICVRAVSKAAQGWWWYDSNVNQGMLDYTRSGMLAGFEGAMWWEKNVNQPMVAQSRESLCDFLSPCQDKLIPYLPHGTLSINLPSILVGAGIAGRGGLELGFDNKGNLIFLGGVGGGGVAPASGGIGVGVKFTNAPTVDKLSGWSVQLGGSGGEGLVVGAEWVFFKDQERNRYNGLAIQVGLGAKFPVPAEGHGTAEHGWILFGPYNYRDNLYLRLCKK